MRPFQLVGIIFTSLLIGACTSLSKSDCAQMDWAQKGLEDGKSGKAGNLINEHSEICGKHGFQSDKEAWTKNYAEGIKSFCTEPQGFLTGRQGRINPQTCPTELAGEFARGFKRGASEFKVEEALRVEKEELVRKESAKRDAVAAAQARNQCSFDFDCGTERTCRRDSEVVEGEFISVGICQ
jgi:hypothetical protein